MVELRDVKLDDVQLLARWDLDPEVASALGGAGADWYDWPAELQRSVSWRHLLIIVDDGRPVGFMQLLDAREDESSYWGDVEPGTWAIDVWIGDERDRGRGVGEAAMRVALDRLFIEFGAERVVIDPLVTNRRAIDFYERLGFSVVERRQLGDEHCLVMRMSRCRWHSSGSPP